MILNDELLRQYGVNDDMIDTAETKARGDVAFVLGYTLAYAETAAIHHSDTDHGGQPLPAECGSCWAFKHMLAMWATKR